MPSVLDQRQRLPSNAGRDRARTPSPGQARGGRGGLFDSPERLTYAPSPISEPSRMQQRNTAGHSLYDPTGDDRGGVAGMRDPYENPTRSQLLGAQSRLRQDKASRALQEVSQRYRMLYGGHHVVRKGLQRSIADAYAAYVGQVVKLPEDTYGLALRALDGAFNTGGLPPGAIDNKLHASPHASSRSKRAEIFHTAHKIMRDLGAYVYDVSYYCPGELDELREMRQPRSALSSRAPKEVAGASGKRGPRVYGGESAEGREAAAMSHTHAQGSPRPASRRAAGMAPRIGARSPRPTSKVNPVTGALRVGPAAAEEEEEHFHPQYHQRQRPFPVADAASAQWRRPASLPARPLTTGSDGCRGSGGAAVEPSAEAEVAEVEDRDVRYPVRLDPLEDRQRQKLRRRSSPGWFPKTPPHYRVSKLYDHVTPTQRVLEQLQQRALAAVKEKLARREGAAAAALSAAADIADAAAAAAEAAAVVDGQKMGKRAEEQKERLATAADGDSGHPALRRSSPPLQPKQTGMYPDLDGASDVDSVGNARLLWIIDTAYELGVANVLGLEEPPPYPRSQRLRPMEHRRQFYEGLYSSPERYSSYTPYAPPSQYNPTPSGKRMVTGPEQVVAPYEQAGPPVASYEYGYDEYRSRLRGGQTPAPASRRLPLGREPASMPMASLEVESRAHPRSSRLSP